MGFIRAITIFTLFVISAYIAGAVLAYPLKLLLDPVFDLAYRKYLTYATLGCGLIVSGIYLYLYDLLSCDAFGYGVKTKPFLKALVKGFLLGIVIMLVIESLLLFLGIHEFDSTRNITLYAVLLLLLKGIFLGLLIAVAEESIFRGGLFAGLHQKAGAVAAVFFSSLIYAAVHFIRYPDPPPDADINWLTGLTLMPEAFRRFYAWSIEDYFLTLFIFGVFLSLLRLRHRHIAACIGVHAGVFMLIKVSKYFTNRNHDSSYEYLVSQYNATFGWLSFSVVLLFTVGYFIMQMKKKQMS